MNKDEALAIFTLAGLSPIQYWELPNGYDRDNRTDPWWLVMTILGPIQIGWRKRVISIDWTACTFGHLPVRCVVTEDDVTKDDVMVHAYSTAKAVEYLSNLKNLALAPHGV